MPRTEWRTLAACRDMDPQVFFPIGATGPALEQLAAAKAVCAGCPVRTRCSEWAIDSGQDAGVWGGTDPEERRALRKTRRPVGGERVRDDLAGGRGR